MSNQHQMQSISSDHHDENETISSNSEDEHINIIPETSLKEMITKKTLRGRPKKRPFPEEPRCSICLEYSSHSSEALIECKICLGTFHPSCYPRTLTPEEICNFTCQRCIIATIEKTPLNSFRCFICDGCDGILVRNPVTKEFYHILCFKCLPELYENYSCPEDVTRGKIRKWRYKVSCKYCQSKLCKTKAVIKCSNTKCKECYHIPCAIEKGMIFSIPFLYMYHKKNTDNNVIPFHCSAHNKRVTAAYRKQVLQNTMNKKINGKFPKSISVNSTICSFDDMNKISKTNIVSNKNKSIEKHFLIDVKKEKEKEDDCFGNKFLDININELMNMEDIKEDKVQNIDFNYFNTFSNDDDSFQFNFDFEHSVNFYSD